MMCIVIAVSAAACLRWGDWRHWKQYYPTILFVISGDLIYNFVFHDFTLWRYAGWPNHTTVNLLFMFFLYPSVVMLFLSKAPQKGIVLGALYIITWSAVGMALEWISWRLGGMVYENGWTIWWSGAFFCMGYSLIRLHHQKPIQAWIAAFLFLGLFLSIFNVPLLKLK